MGKLYTSIVLIPFVLAAILGVPDLDVVSTPAPAALIAQDANPVGSGSAGCPVETQSRAWGSVPSLAKVPKVALLIEAQVLEKYRSFRDSLTTP